MSGPETRRILPLGLSILIALLSLIVLLLSGRISSSASTTDTIRYVSWNNGNDTGNCNDPASPCATIGYALNHAVAGDTIYVAKGLYLENLSIDQPIFLEGGYEANGWTRDVAQNETVIDGFAGRYIVADWDGRAVVKPTVIKDGNQYKIWFDGTNVLGETRIGFASSTDGLNWNKYLGNPVIGDVDASWNNHSERAPFVLKENGTYKMWFEYVGGNGSRQLAYATSLNGVNWTVDPSYPTLPSGPDGFDQNAAGHGSILNDNGIYKLWYHAQGTEGEIVAYATSSDGISWTKQGPVLKPAGTSWESETLWGPTVLKINGVYWMWYAGWGNNTGSIGVVTSTNGLTWNRFQSAPVISDTKATLGDPQVISDGGKLKMWYSAWYNDPVAGIWRGRIDYAESADGIHWSKPVSNPVLGPANLGKVGKSTIYFEQDSDGSVVDGFTIRGGHSPYGAGISIHAADIIISNNVIKENRAEFGDGGIQAWGESSVLIDNNAVRDNRAQGGAGGGITIADSEGNISNNQIENNTSFHGGGGIFFVRASGSVSRNEIVNNHTQTGGGGILVIDTEQVISITQNKIDSNVAGWGGGIQIGNAGILVESNDIRNNRAEYWDYGAGGVAVDGPESRQVTLVNNLIVDNDNEGIEVANFAELLIANNTIVGNGRVGIEVFAWPSVPPDPFTARVNNNIVIGHAGCGVTGFNGVTIIARNNDVWNNSVNYCAPYVDWNNISENPLFVDGSSGDYHLRFGSRAIDAGTSEGAPGYDLDGNLRPFGDGFDIGAYEWPPFRLSLPLILREE